MNATNRALSLMTLLNAPNGGKSLGGKSKQSPLYMPH